MVKVSFPEFLALCYSAVFHFALTKKELYRYSINPQSVSYFFKKNKNSFQKKYPLFSHLIQKKGKYYFLKKIKVSNDDIQKRRRRARKKLSYAKKILFFYRFIPTISMIGITGGVAAEDARLNDDIDVLIVAKSGWLWTTRFLVIVLSELIRVRRKPTDTAFSNKLCFNMFIDEGHLMLPKNEQDLFAANEVLRMKVLWERDNTKKRFYIANQWAKKYLIHYPYHSANTYYTIKKINSNSIENILYKLQYHYMKRRITKEVVSKWYVRFHPKDARGYVISKFKSFIQKNVAG